MLISALLLMAGSVFADIPGTTVSLPKLSTTINPRLVVPLPDGTVWFDEEKFTPHTMGYFTPDGNVTKFNIPCEQCEAIGNFMSYVESMTVGPDGNIWFVWARVAGDGSPIENGVSNFVSRVTRDGTFTTFPVPTKYAFRRFLGFNGHSAIITGPDGNLWFSECTGNKIGRITTAGVLTEFVVPTAVLVPTAPTNIMTSFASGLTRGSDGNLWFVENKTDKIARITMSGSITEFPLPAHSAPYWITTGTDGNLWLTEIGTAGRASMIARVSTAGAVTEFAIPNGTDSPLEITSAPDKNLWFTLASGSVARIEMLAGGAAPAITTSAVPQSARPFEIAFASSATSASTATLQQSTVTSPARPEAAPATGRRHAVGPTRTFWTGKVTLTLKMPLKDDQRAYFEQHPTELVSQGVTLTAEGLQFATKPAAGFRVIVDDELAMTGLDGVFHLALPPRAGAQIHVTGTDGFFDKTVPVQDHAAINGAPVTPIDFAVTLSNGPNGMNDYPTETASLIDLDAVPPDQGFPCGSHKDCKLAKCPPNRCCLDYDGACADKPLTRWECTPLRVQQFIGSTCQWWVSKGSCINEGAITFGRGPGCFDNHRGRECQDIDATELGLQLTTGEIQPNAPPPDPRDLLPISLFSDSSTEETTAFCSDFVQIQLHNNSQSNDTEVQFNPSFAVPFISCLANGQIDRLGTIEHFEQIGESTQSTETTGAYRHINDFSILYAAPPTLACDPATDYVVAQAAGHVRTVKVRVTCGGSDPTHGMAIPSPVITPPSGAYPNSFDATITSSVPNAEIHYTLDGNTPNILSPMIGSGGTIHITAAATVKARAFLRSSGGKRSFVTTQNYQIYRQLDATITRVDETPNGTCKPIKVRYSIKPANDKTKIAITVDGSEPLEANAILATSGEKTFAPGPPVTIKVRGFRPFYLPSNIATDTLTWGDCGIDGWGTASTSDGDQLMQVHTTPPK